MIAAPVPARRLPTQPSACSHREIPHTARERVENASGFVPAMSPGPVHLHPARRSDAAGGVVLGDGVYSRAVSLVFGFPIIPDDWLGRDRGHAASELSLRECRYVIQVVGESESRATARWRHRTFVDFYEKRGGTHSRAPGLVWLVLDLAAEGASPLPPPEACRSLLGGTPLANILATLGETEPRDLHVWRALLLDDSGHRTCSEILRLVSGQATEENRDRIVALASSLSRFGWETVCRPPTHHTLAGKISAWLLRAGTSSVTPWFEEGRRLLEDCELSPKP